MTNLKIKKSLAARALDVGKSRIVFILSRLSEIKEALTKQDIRDLKNDGAIIVKDVSGRKKNVNKKKRKTTGKIKKKVKNRKQEYVKMTRKLRKYVLEMKKQGKVSRDEYLDIRKKIRNRIFKSSANLKSYIGGLRK